MCDCINIEIGSYDSQVAMTNWWNGDTECIDRCLWKEIQFLWDSKIKTTGCCCGHNKVEPMINVIPKHHVKMEKLGYEYWINKHGVYCYKPFSVGKRTTTVGVCVVREIRADLVTDNK